jgi:hypothetical protein
VRWPGAKATVGAAARRTALVGPKVIAAAIAADLVRYAFDIAAAAVVFVPVEVETLAIAAGLARGAGVAAGPAVVLVR